MKKRDYISIMMAVTMMIAGASCGSADNSYSSADKGAAPAAPETNGITAGDAADEARAADGAVAETAPAAAEAAEAADGAEGEADYGTAAADDVGKAKKSAAFATLDGMMDAEAFAGAGTSEETAVAGAVAEKGEEPAKAALRDEEPVPEPDDSSVTEEPSELPEAGQLTAGEWNDNNNWGFFSNLVNAGTISFPAFGLDPTNRTAVTVKDSDGNAVVNAKVVLKDGSSEVWHAVTDKSGTAYLFGSGDSYTVTSDGKSQDFDLKAREKDEQGNDTGISSEEVVFDGKGTVFSNAEVRFIVDTTGSMSDELLFLQSDFSAITREVGTDGVKYGVSFYRDEGDDYVTKHLDFTDSVKDIQSSLNNEFADGGGDYPEAVAQVLKETVTEGEWSEDSVKIAFLIFDAPPHEGTEDELLEAAKAAGEKGIRIVPIVSSGSDRETELFARSLAIMSGGTYVFLTDDSGIGGSHLEPIIGDYEVEKLFDIIVRVINDYRQ